MWGQVMTAVKRGDNIKVHYTGKFEDGTVFDSSEGKEPLEIVVGSGQVIPGFDEAVVGMKIGEKKNVFIPVEKAYGIRNDDLVMTVPTAHVPPDIKPEIGLRLEMGAPDGGVLRVVVVDITDEEVILDANPPLAGNNLIFDLELVAITI